MITQIYDEALRSLGYTPSQIMILSNIQELHSANINELAEAVSTDRTTVSRNLLPLKKDGLIKPCDCADRREKAIMLTEKGGKILQKASRIWQEKHQEVLKAVGVKRMADFITDLNGILNVMQKR
ncbi:MAG: winged helix DNA-binding protein [Candidatus Omnitrophica bacterium]|nr:winged helix DNA-binding protein [Candidatus Omnitrophota bacterium]